MAHIWQTLLGNLATVALMMTAWALLSPSIRPRFGLSREAFFGMAMGGGAVISMAMSAEIKPGIYFDLRAGLVVSAALFGGPVAAVFATVMAVTFRLWMAGAGATIGVAGIVAATVLSLLVREAAGSKILFRHVAVLAALQSGAAYLIGNSSVSPLRHLGTAVAGGAVGLNFVCILASGFIILKLRRITMERDLLRAALAQSPDFYYVKDTKSRFRFANEAVARFNKFDDPAAMIGLSDFDIADTSRAAALFDEERHIMAIGGALVNREECLAGENGERWFLTSKVAVHDSEGDVIGLAGITRDITERKRLETEIVQSRDLLKQVMRDMSDGLALFSETGVLLFCNDRYREFFPATAHLRVPGTHIRSILEGVVASKEQTNLPLDKATWIEDIARGLFADHDQDIQTDAGRWLQIRTRVTCNRMALAVVTETTALKQSELAFRSLAERLQLLAETDGLTGLANRRALDEALAAELDRATVARPLSIIMIDVDRFKAYNDHYGHLMGDDCLKQVAHCLIQARQRPDQMMARFGGEEFMVVLPDTNAAAAMDFAEHLQSEVIGMGIKHAKSEHAIVTASMGITVCTGNRSADGVTRLLQEADLALYDAKNAGRHCVRVFGKTDDMLQRVFS